MTTTGVPYCGRSDGQHKVRGCRRLWGECDGEKQLSCKKVDACICGPVSWKMCECSEGSTGSLGNQDLHDGKSKRVDGCRVDMNRELRR